MNITNQSETLLMSPFPHKVVTVPNFRWKRRVTVKRKGFEDAVGEQRFHGRNVLLPDRGARVPR